MIEVSELTKVYRVPKKQPGLWGSVRAVFRRRYDEVRAVDGVGFRIEPGERVGFLGPNGAGKTTTLKMLAGLLVPTGGRIRVAGFVPSDRDPAYLSRITLVMGQKQQLLWDLPPRETFELNRAVFGLERNAFRKTLDELIELLDVKDLIDRPVRNLSLGERMKCELAAALLHRPDVLFLDEPTIGLDVTMQAVVRRFVAEWNKRAGATVLLTSHYMADISALCARVIVVSQGRVSYDGALDELVKRYAPDRRVIVQTTREPTADELASAAPFALREGSYEASVPKAEAKDAVDRALRTLPVRDLIIEEPRLEDVIARLFAEHEVRGEQRTDPAQAGGAAAEGEPRA